MVARVHRGYTEKVPGFAVVGVAHSGKSALELIREIQPDLLLMDVYLPDMSGLEVVRTLRAQVLPVDVIMVTAAKDVETLHEAIQVGVLHYIIKPFSFERFERTLDSYRRFRAKRQVASTLRQEDVDQLFGLVGRSASDELPKGLNRPTLDRVVGHLATTSHPVSARDVAVGLGLSRATARRYLEFLQRRGQATLNLRYGSAGRPEHRYGLVG